MYNQHRGYVPRFNLFSFGGGMVKKIETTNRRSVLSRRLKKFIEARKTSSKTLTKLSKKDRAYSLLLTSNDEKSNYATLVIQISCLQFRFFLPKIIKPLKSTVYASVKGFNRKTWSYVYAPTVYGVGYLPKEKVFHLFYGVNSGNSKGFPKDKLFIWVSPWSRYYLYRHSIKDKNNDTFWEKTFNIKSGKEKPVETEVIGALCPKLRFECINEKACRVIGSAFIDEKEWRKGVYWFGRPMLGSSNIIRRVLKIHLQINNCHSECKPTSEFMDFVMLKNETLRDAVYRFCKSRVLDDDDNKRLYLEYIEESKAN